jgi:hypothetical protein
MQVMGFSTLVEDIKKSEKTIRHEGMLFPKRKGFTFIPKGNLFI